LRSPELSVVVAADYGVPWIAPSNPHAPDVAARVAALAPEFLFAGLPARVPRTRVIENSSAPGMPALSVRQGTILARCGGSGTLTIRELEIEGRPTDAAALVSRWGRGAPLGA
jgi:hypothetical protein